MSEFSCQPPELFFKGSRIGVLLIHGLTGTPTEMGSVAKDLNRRGFSVFCPLLAGHCQSEAEFMKTNRFDWFKSVETAFEKFSEHMDVVFIGGMSVGAIFCLKLAAMFPQRIRGQALYSTTLKWDGWSIPKLSFLLPLALRVPIFGKRYRFMEAWPYGIKNERLRERIYKMMYSGDATQAGFPGTPGLAVRELWRFNDEVKARFAEVATPTLLLHASNDDIASAKNNACYVQKRISGPSKLVLLDDSYHMITIDQEKRKVSQETAGYFYDLLSEEEKRQLDAHAIRSGS